MSETSKQNSVDRAERLATALRENLRRRKAQGKERRDDADQPAPDISPDKES